MLANVRAKGNFLWNRSYFLFHIFMLQNKVNRRCKKKYIVIMFYMFFYKYMCVRLIKLLIFSYGTA